MTDYQQPSYLRALRWGCADECRYECMWRSVDQFQENQQAVPQFYGKVTGPFLIKHTFFENEHVPVAV